MKTVGLKPALVITFIIQALGLVAAFAAEGHFTTVTYLQLAAALVNLVGVIFVGPGVVTDGQNAVEPPHPELATAQAAKPKRARKKKDAPPVIEGGK